MRQWIGLIALALGFVAVLQAEGQVTTQQFVISGSHAQSLQGSATKPVINVPISLNNVTVPFPRQDNGGFLSGLFRSVGKIGSPLVGQSNYPAPSSFPSTRYPNTFQPLAPKTN